ncbi:WxL domain-containing protein, partial [Pseudomonas monteilii]|nr:WxL domain-containing protein [Pseudomonas monteilii]
ASGQENQPTHSEQLSLLPGVSSTVAQAQAGSGLETWLFAFGTTDQAAESVVLHLESEQERQTGTYETTLEWILQSVPDNVIQ